MTFPQFRKYSNNKSYFKIISATQWEELQVIGSKIKLSVFEVKILPDRNFMNDMLVNEGNRWEVVDETEYNLLKSKAAI
jgi:hypothetical protein